MRELKFCPHCGAETLTFQENKKWHCPKCDFTLYHNVAGAVAVLICCGDEILFTQRNQEPKLGKLDLPGGFTDPEESAEQSCARELHEELNINIHPEKLRYLTSLPNTYLYKDILYNTLDLFFEYQIDTKMEMQLELSEISKVVWVKRSELQIDQLAFDSQKTFFSKISNF